jgi:hypothetical protein
MRKFKVISVANIGIRKAVVVSVIEGEIEEGMVLNSMDNNNSWIVKGKTLQSFSGKMTDEKLRTLFLEPIDHSSLPNEGMVLTSI